MGRLGITLTILLLNAIHSLPAALPNVFYGDVYDENGNLLYREKHNVTKENEKITEIKTQIFDLYEKVIVQIQSNFQSSFYLPNFQSERIRDGLVARAIKDGDRIALLKKEKSWHKYVYKTFEVESDMVVGHGYYFYLLDHIDQLVKEKKEIDISFLIPNRLEKVDFSMTAEIDPESPDVVAITLVPTNPFHQMFIKKIIIRINRSTQRLISYEGPNSFLDMKKVIPYIQIKYHE